MEPFVFAMQILSTSSVKLFIIYYWEEIFSFLLECGNDRCLLFTSEQWDFANFWMNKWQCQMLCCLVA